ncbi:DJ-1 family glyoxalase III [Spiroplasma endosymbiont of 'Nebria riversi']|uniref:DJ-1 family glyoxalase III n=1 Tax=Spiroplasma endosymbiont of 'Nebria riversi' TaxID=2792084 RepID=UPI001C04ED25|nr:DJ-1 family glyoxalase III [Spiroplasma endosymbiont of 'Nebria riversi']
MATVAIFLATGYEEIEAITVIDILRRAKINIDIISSENKDFIVGANNITIKSDYYFSQMPNDYAMLILPGGATGVNNLQKNEHLMNLLKTFNEQNKFIAAICAAPQILGLLGIANNKNISVYPEFFNGLETAKIISSEAVVIDGHIITASSAGVAIKFALQLVAILTNDNIKEMITKQLVIL